MGKVIPTLAAAVERFVVLIFVRNGVVHDGAALDPPEVRTCPDVP